MKSWSKVVAGAWMAVGVLVWAGTAGAEGFVSYDAGAGAAPEVSLNLRGVALKNAAEQVAALGAVEVRVAEGLADDKVSLVSGSGLGGAALVPVFSSVLLSLGYDVAHEEGRLTVTKPSLGESIDIVLDTKELEADFRDVDTSKLLTLLMPTMAMDDAGNVIGLTGNLGALPVSEKLGLRNGDILHKLNGVLIDNLMVVMQLADQFEGDSFTATVLRDGQPIQLNYTIKQ